MQIVREFREFAVRGNVVDMAVGIIIGGALGKIVTSLVNDIVMPPIGLLVGQADFSKLHFNLSLPTTDASVDVRYGLFLNSVVDFLIIAVVIFLLVRQVNRLRRTEAAPPPPSTKTCPYCASNIPLAAVRCPQCTSQLEAAAT